MSSMIRSRIEQHFIHINSLPWSNTTPEMYERFSNFCRAAALVLAREGNFNDAFFISSLMESLWVQNETPSTWALFYTDIAKAILSQQHQHEAMAAVRSNQRFKSLQKIVKKLPPLEAGPFSIFLDICQQRTKL